MQWNIISYPLFADADTGIYPHAASQHYARLKAKRGIVLLSVDKFLYSHQQTRGNEFIPCLNDVCQIPKRFRSFKISDTPLTWPKSSYKHSVARLHRCGKESGRRSWSSLWRHQWRSLIIITHADDIKCEIRFLLYFTVVNQSEARISTEHEIKHYIAYSIAVTETEHKSGVYTEKEIPYLSLMGELWDVCYEELGENWLL